MNFLDPLLTSDGKPYAPTRYAEIVEERYLISKFIHTSYGDLSEVTPLERKYLLQYIKRDIERENEIKRKAAESK